jgi:RHS repeat-associated protein
VTTATATTVASPDGAALSSGAQMTAATSATVGDVIGEAQVTGTNLDVIEVPVTNAAPHGDPTAANFLFVWCWNHGDSGTWNGEEFITDDAPTSAPYWQSNMVRPPGLTNFGPVPYLILSSLQVGNTVRVSFPGAHYDWLACRLHLVSGLAADNPLGPEPGGNYVGFGGGFFGTSPQTRSGNPVAVWLGLVSVWGRDSGVDANFRWDPGSVAEQYGFDRGTQEHIGYAMHDYGTTPITADQTFYFGTGTRLGSFGAGFFHVGAGWPYPPVPTSDAPLDSAQIATCGSTPVFRAQAVSGSAVQYQFQVAVTPDFGASSIAADSGPLPATNTWSPPPGALANGGNYFWRWKTDSGSYSTPRSFSIKVPRVGAGEGSGPMWSQGPLGVNEISGNLIVSLPGSSYPTATNALSAHVSYNSQLSADEGLGPGWLLDAGASGSGAPMRLVDHNLLGTDRMDAIEAQFDDGSSVCFRHVADTRTYLAPAGITARLSENADSTWTYSDGATFATYGVADRTSARAQPTSIEQLAAIAGKGALAYAFSTQDPSKVARVTDDSGRTLIFSWHSLEPSSCVSAIVCVTGPDGVTWRYLGNDTGGTSGRLATISDGVRDIAAISYDSSGRFTKLQNANDLDPAHASPGYNAAHALTIGYDSNGRVASVSEGPITGQTPPTSTTTFDYEPGSTTTTPTRAAHVGIAAGTPRTADGYTTVTPPNQQGQASPKFDKVVYDNDGNAIEREDVLGNLTLAGYNSRDELLWTEDEDGNPTDYNYDTVNDVLLSRQDSDADGTGPLGRPVTSYRYDETQVGNTASPGPGLQGLQAFYYDNINLIGRPKLIESDRTIDFNWGSSGPAGLGINDNFSVRWTGNLFVANPGAYTLSTAADDGTRLVVDGIVAVDNWKDQGTTTVSSQPISLSAGLHKLELGYYEHFGGAEIHLRWACGSCSPAIAAQVIPASALKPAWLNQTSVVSPAGRLSFNHFNEPWTGNPQYTLVTAPVNGTSASLVTSYSFDTYGRIAGKVMPNGNPSPTIDPASGDLTNPGVPATSDYGTVYSYYAADETAAPLAVCGGGNEVNQAGLPKTTSSHGLHEETAVYDSAGRLVADTNGAGTSCDYYNAEGRLISDKVAGDSNATSYTYDPAGDLLTTSHPDGSDDTAGTISSIYDEAGRVVNVTDANGAEASFVYDADSNLTSRTVAKGPIASSTTYTNGYTYNEADQLKDQTDPANRVFRFYYDRRGNLRGTQYPNGTFSWADTNPAGLLSDLFNRHGTINASTVTPPADASPISDFSYQYNLDGQKTQEQRATDTPVPTLTMSSNEITDATRSAGVEGDGRAAPDSSYGIWEQTTNQMRNGGVETNTNDWVNLGSVSSGRDTSWAKFGSASLKVVTAGGIAGQGVAVQTNTGLALPPGTAESGAVWVKGSGQFTALLRIYNTDGSQTNGTSVTVTLSSTPQRVVVGAAVAGGKTGNQVELRFSTKSAQVVTFWADGAQIERLSIETPYVQTDGSTAGRVAGRVQAPASLLNPRQGWIALRVRAGIANSDLSTSRTPVLFQWRDDATHYLKLYISSGKKWTLERDGTASAVGINTGTFTPGTLVTVVAAWTATSLKLSINGAAFTSVNNSNVPALAATLFDLGSAVGSSQLDGDALWFVSGTGTLANTDATTLNTLGNSDPTLTTLPTTSSQTAVWSADNNTYQTPDTGQTSTRYTYDSIGRLERVTRASNDCTAYWYDRDSNRTQIRTSSDAGCSAFTTSHTYGYQTATSIPLDALTSVTPSGSGATNYHYTSDGQLDCRGTYTTNCSGDTFVWDGLGRITKASVSGSSVCYTYDPANQLKSRNYKTNANDCTNPSRMTNYLLGGLIETDGLGAITTSFDDGPAGNLASYNGSPDAGSTITYLYYTGHGDVAAEVDDSGTTTARHTYDPWGVPGDSPPADATSHRFVGKWNKQYDSSAGFILMGARPYDPRLGRFIAVDPIDGGSLNNYDYAGQDPVNGYDLDGTCWNIFCHPVKAFKAGASKVKNAAVRAYNFLNNLGEPATLKPGQSARFESRDAVRRAFGAPSESPIAAATNRFFRGAPAKSARDFTISNVKGNLVLDYRVPSRTEGFSKIYGAVVGRDGSLRRFSFIQHPDGSYSKFQWLGGK